MNAEVPLHDEENNIHAYEIEDSNCEFKDDQHVNGTHQHYERQYVELSKANVKMSLRDYRFCFRVKYLFLDQNYLNLHEPLETQEILIGSSNDYICYFLNEGSMYKIVGFLVAAIQTTIYMFSICAQRNDEISNSYINYNFVTIVISFYVAISVISNTSDNLNKILFSNLTWPFVADYVPDEITLSNWGWVMIYAIFKPIINILHVLSDLVRSILRLHTTDTPSLTFHRIAVCVIMTMEVFIQFLLINTASLVIKSSDDIYMLLVEIFGLYFVIQLDELVAQFFHVKVDCLVLSVDQNVKRKWRTFRSLSRFFYMLVYTGIILFLSSVKIDYANFCEHVII
jgi:hypothetical protein